MQDAESFCYFMGMKVIGFYTRHDSNVAITVDGKVSLALELERLFQQRYFKSSLRHRRFRRQWKRTRDVLRLETGLERFDVAVTSGAPTWQKEILQGLFRADRWHEVDHHHAHAAIGFYDSRCETALIISYDGGGNDGTFNLFQGSGQSIERLATLPHNLGSSYRAVGTWMPEVAGPLPQRRGGHLSIAGKLMAYAALGKVMKEWKPAIRTYFRDFRRFGADLAQLRLALGWADAGEAHSPETARNLAATLQAVFEEVLIEVLEPHISQHRPKALVLTGGCALNVAANQALVSRFGLPVFVPPNPGDGGIGLGAAFLVEPPLELPGAFLGPELFDSATLPNQVRGRGARRLAARELAVLLVEGAVIGVARGRAEFGPRALGNRSILCYPEGPHLKERLNLKVKFREWYRPFAPAVPQEDVHWFTDEPIISPYMSFAPALNGSAASKFPAIAHLDGTARIQTVAAASNPWLHELLTHVKSLTGHAILLNTSFNTRGKPLINYIPDALQMLDEGLLDYVLLEDWLFSPARTDSVAPTHLEIEAPL